MNRRELIKAVVPMALVPTLTANGVTLAATARIVPGHYMLFVDPMAIDIEALCAAEAPEGATVEIHAVHVRPGQSVQDAVALYKLPEGKN